MSVTTPFWISAFLDFAPDVSDRGVRFWRRVTGYSLSPARGQHSEFATLVPETGDAFLRVQRLVRGPSRVHLDLHVGDIEAAVDEAVALGARVEARPPGGYVVLSSPGGLIFCLVRHPATTRPVPAHWPGGFTSIVDQVCLDIPAGAHDAEVAFWANLTGWEQRFSPGAPEFSHLLRPPRQPFRILLQRLGEASGPVRAHLDLATTDQDAETARHVALGATVRQRHEHWTVMADPAGAAYCITTRSPETGMLP